MHIHKKAFNNRKKHSIYLGLSDDCTGFVLALLVEATMIHIVQAIKNTQFIDQNLSSAYVSKKDYML